MTVSLTGFDEYSGVGLGYLLFSPFALEGGGCRTVWLSSISTTHLVFNSISAEIRLLLLLLLFIKGGGVFEGLFCENRARATLPSFQNSKQQ